MRTASRRQSLRWLAATSMAVLGSQWLRQGDVLAKGYSLTYGAHPGYEDYMFAARDWTSKYNLQTKVQWYSAGGPSDQAVISGRLDADSPGSGPVISLNSALPGKLTLVMVWAYGDYSAVLVRPGSAYRTMADLKGKRIGVLVGSGAYMTWLIYLQANGLQLGEFNVVNMNGEDIPAALSGKVIEAGVVWDPFVSLMTYRRIGRILALFSKYVDDMGLLQVRTDIVQRQRDAVVRLVAGAMDCQDFIRRHPDQTAQVVSAQLQAQGVDVPWQAFVEAISKRLIWQPDFSPKVRMSLDELGRVALKLGKIKRLPQYSYAVDIINEAKQLRARS
jgi:NitT/TauT family transport system substrate-binding protein